MLTNENQIQVIISPLELSDTGDSTILAYQIMWDSGSGTLDVIVQESTELSATVTGVVAQQDYLFKVRALNVYGYGVFSETVTIRSSDVPKEMVPPVTIVAATTLVMSWSAADDSGEAVTQYEI